MTLKKRKVTQYKSFFSILFLANIIIVEELRKTSKSVADLINTWVDLMRANTEHNTDINATKWHSSLGYNKCIENIEIVISEKLELTLLESKIMLNSKKK